MINKSISLDIWDCTYRGPEDNYIEDTMKRIAKSCSLVEKEEIRDQCYRDFLWVLSDFRGSTGGRITANIGINERISTTLYNCFVHSPIDLGMKEVDSIEGIYNLLKAQAHTLKSEGGYGMNFSWLRPAGSYVRGIGGRTPGVVKFMELWDKSAEIITIGDDTNKLKVKKEEKKKIRKGAQMGVLCIWHPDVEQFIDSKLVQGRFTKFNISIGITEGFMNALLNNDNWDLKFPDTEFEKYDDEWDGDIKAWENKGYPTIIHKTIKAEELWNKIMKATYSRNDPGVLFLDIANKLNPLYYCENAQTSNPCGEIIMGGPGGVCLLFSLNLVKYIKKENGKFIFDFETFTKAVNIAIRLSDNVNDISRTPLPEYDDAIKKKRRIGVGVVGLGSLLYILGLRYGSKESLELIEEIFKCKAETEILASAKLGKEKGSFELFDRNKYFSSYWWKTLPISEDVKKQVEDIGEMRNSHHSANAPTGNMSLYVGGVSNGIEPVAWREYNRWITVSDSEKAILKEKGFKFPNVHNGEWFETDLLKQSKIGTDDILLGLYDGIEYQIDKNRGLTKKVNIEDYGWSFVKQNYTKDQIKEMEKNNVFASIDDLTIDEHIEPLKVITKYVNMNSSKTVNIPNNFKYDDFKNLYIDAWKNNIKGITSYRAGTMTSVLESKNNRPTSIINSVSPKRPECLFCDIQTTSVKGIKWVVLVGLLEDRPYEIFAGSSENLSLPLKYKKGKLCKNGNGVYNLHVDVGNDELIIKNVVKTFDDPEHAWATRMISMSLRHGVAIEFIVEQLAKDGGMGDLNKVLSRILKKYIYDGTKVVKKITCPECSSTDFIFIEGCVSCKNCSWSKCQ